MASAIGVQCAEGSHELGQQGERDGVERLRSIDRQEGHASGRRALPERSRGREGNADQRAG